MEGARAEVIESVEWVAYVAAKETEAAAPEATEAATAAPRRIAGALLQGDAPARDGGVREELAAGVKGVDRPAGGSIQNASGLPQGPAAGSVVG